MARDPTVVGRNRFGPQEPQADAPENADPGSRLPQFYECGICGSMHPASWDGDCRDDNNRLTADELDDKYGSLGWEEVPMPGGEDE